MAILDMEVLENFDMDIVSGTNVRPVPVELREDDEIMEGLVVSAGIDCGVISLRARGSSVSAVTSLDAKMAAPPSSASEIRRRRLK